MDPSKLLGQTKVLAYTAACAGAAGLHASIPPLPLTLALTKRFQREDRIKSLHQMVLWAHNCRKYLFKIDLRLVGAENLPSPSRGHIYISNHQSWIDILVLMEALDTVAFLSKEMVKFIPGIGQCAYGGGTIFFDRKSKRSRLQALKDTLKMCERSTAVVLFPEGTRSFDGELRQEIQQGAIRAAYKRGLKVVPVALDGTCQVLPKTMDRLNRGRPVAVTIGEVIEPASVESAEQFVAQVWGTVTDLFQQSRARLAR